MNRLHRTRRVATLSVVILSLAFTSACQSPPREPARPMPATSCGPEGPITMPPGVDLHRLRLLDEGKQMAVYTAVADVDASKRDKRQLPASMQALVELTNDQLLRMFSDAVKSSKRFIVFDSKATLTNEYSNSLVDLQVTSASQKFLPIEPTRRVVQSSVSVSLNLTDMLNGEDLLGDAIVVDGRTGTTSGGRLVISSADDLRSPDVRQRLGADYVDALKNAFFQIRLELESKLRPMAKVLSVDGCAVGLAGGSRHGLQPGDQLVLFRPQMTELGGKRTLSATRPVALVKCDGVGTLTSQCQVIQTVRGLQPSKEDYAVITSASLLAARQR